jgi:tetratricopeptide (TPR) repeat protein
VLEEARALVQVGEPEKAAGLALEAVGLLEAASPHDAGRGYALVAEVYEQLGDTAKALELYELAAERLEAQPGRYLVEVYSKLARLLEDNGQKDEALQVLKRAVTARGKSS